MVGKAGYAKVQHKGPLCTRSGFGSQCLAKIWILGTDDQPTFAVLKQLELTSVVP